jgi:hemin uptake protein HemP
MNQDKAASAGAEPQARTSQATDAVVMPRISSTSLLGAHRSIEIAHGGHIYRLSQTLQGKLILTK